MGAKAEIPLSIKKGAGIFVCSKKLHFLGDLRGIDLYLWMAKKRGNRERRKEYSRKRISLQVACFGAANCLKHRVTGQ